MLTPEEIEAIDASNFPHILEIAKSLHSSLGNDMSYESPVAIEEMMELRERLIIQIEKSCASLSSDISKMRALKKELEIAKMIATSDKRTLNSRKFDLIRSIKDNNL